MGAPGEDAPADDSGIGRRSVKSGAALAAKRLDAAGGSGIRSTQLASVESSGEAAVLFSHDKLDSGPPNGRDGEHHYQPLQELVAVGGSCLSMVGGPMEFMGGGPFSSFLGAVLLVAGHLAHILHDSWSS